MAHKTAISLKADPRLMHLELIAQDSSLGSALLSTFWVFCHQKPSHSFVAFLAYCLHVTLGRRLRDRAPEG